MIDKMQIWTSRVERIMDEERLALPAYDQAALVREHDYLHTDPDVLFEQLRQECERFATLVERIAVKSQSFLPLQHIIVAYFQREILEKPCKNKLK